MVVEAVFSGNLVCGSIAPFNLDSPEVVKGAWWFTAQLHSLQILSLSHNLSMDWAVFRIQHGRSCFLSLVLRKGVCCKGVCRKDAQRQRQPQR